MLSDVSGRADVSGCADVTGHAEVLYELPFEQGDKRNRE